MATILDWLQGINPMYAGGLIPQYMTGENSLQQALASRLFGYQQAENAANQAYEAGIGDLAQQEPLSQESLRNAMANRGMLRSGMTVRGTADIGTQFNKLRAQLGQQKMKALADAAAGRTDAYSAYGQGESELQGNIAQSGMNALGQDAQAQANLMTAQQQSTYNDQMLALQRQMAQNQYDAMRAGEPTATNPYSPAYTYAGSFTSGTGQANTTPRTGPDAAYTGSGYAPNAVSRYPTAVPTAPTGTPNVKPVVPTRYYARRS